MPSPCPSYVHPLPLDGEQLPAQFTYPFRYTPHPLCRKAACLVQEKLREMGVTEGKMYGVLVVKNHASMQGQGEQLAFLAAYSGQLQPRASAPDSADGWFVPPVVDYLSPDSYFQREQAEIMAMSREIEERRNSEERKAWAQRLALLRAEREAAVAEAKRVYEEGRRPTPAPSLTGGASAEYIRLRQFQKANIHRAKQMHRDEIATLEERLAAHNALVHQLTEQRKERSEALQQWLFAQFNFLNGRGESRNLLEIRPTPNPSRKGGTIPSGAGECCGPKLLQTAYRMGLEPVAMAEFWWGRSHPGHYREPGAFFPACHTKCRPILTFMLQGLDVEPDPALHYEQALKPVSVLWEDEHLAVIVKPEGWCSIPGRSDQANLFDEALRLWPGIEGSVIVHRLDMDTSGVMLIAKNAQIHRALGRQFELREVKKRYVALLERAPQVPPQTSSTQHGMPAGTLSLPLGPDLENMPRQRVDWEHGKEAVTRYEVLGAGNRIAFYPQTGRTHQLRVHASSPEGLNAPIVGDRLYGHVADRLYLHAEAIEFTHPVTRERMYFEAPAPF